MDTSAHRPEEALQVRSAEVRAALARVLIENLRPVVTALAGLYFVYAFGHPVFVGGPRGVVLSGLAVATGLVLAGLRLRWDRWPRRVPGPHVLGAVVVGLVLLNALLHLILTDDLRQSTNVILLLLAVGALALSTRWYAVLVGGTLAGWGAAVWATLPHESLPHYGFAVVSAAVLSTVIHRVRLQSAWNEQRERLAGRRLRTALEHSLASEARARRELEQSNAALEKAVAEAEEMNRLQAAFLADMSHEIRTPLTSIIGFAEVLDEEAMRDRSQRFARLVLESSRRLLSTLNSVLDLSKLKTKEVHLEPERTDVGAEVRDTVRLFQAQAEEAGVALSVEGPAALDARLDPSALHRCCSNLVSNAIKYTDEGGRVRVELEATDDAVTVRVADTGRGIDPALRDELFEPFEQGDVRDEGGTGLGLAITKRLVGLMGGTIEVDSTPGDGSVFAIEVPRWVDA